MKKAKNLDQQLARLEAQANDELELLNDLGPAVFPTADLVELKNLIDRRLAAHDFYQKRIVLMGATAVIWLGLGVVFLAIGWAVAGRVSLFLMPFSVTAFLAGAFFLNKNFRTRGHWTGLRDEVLDELLRRQTRSVEKKSGPKKG